MLEHQDEHAERGRQAEQVHHQRLQGQHDRPRDDEEQHDVVSARIASAYGRCRLRMAAVSRYDAVLPRDHRPRAARAGVRTSCFVCALIARARGITSTVHSCGPSRCGGATATTPGNRGTRGDAARSSAAARRAPVRTPRGARPRPAARSRRREHRRVDADEAHAEERQPERHEQRRRADSDRDGPGASPSERSGTSRRARRARGALGSSLPAPRASAFTRVPSTAKSGASTSSATTRRAGRR